MEHATMSRRRSIAVLAGVLLGVFLASLDQTIVGTALPRVIAQLGGLSLYTWVFTAYMLTSTTALPIFGKLSDMYGRRWFLIGGLLLFMFSSALCGASQNIEMLIIFRGLQGIAGAMIMSSNMAIIGDIFPPAERGKYQGIIASAFGLASIIGPTAGGYITDNLSWRWVFYVNIPVGLLAVAVLFVALPRFAEVHHKRSVDYLGAGALIAAAVPLLLALSWAGQEYAWASPQIIGMLAFSGVAMVALIVVERHAQEPILPLSLFRNRIFTVSAAAGFLLSIGMFVAVMFLPLFIQGVQGNSATASGMVLTPLMLSTMVASVISGQVISRTGKYLGVTIIGSAIVAVGAFFFSTMNIATTNEQVVLYMILAGFGLGITMPVFVIAVQNAFPQKMLGVVTASLQFFRGIGGAMGVAVLGTVLVNQMTQQLASRLPAELVSRMPADAVSGGMGEMQSLLDPDNMAKLKAVFAQFGPQGQALLDQFVLAVRESMAFSLQQVFFIGFLLVTLSLVATFFLKEIPLRKGAKKEAAQAKPVPETVTIAK